jgi:hypothetical protein
MSMALYERNWVEQANCKDMDKSVFFPSSNTELKQAKKVCSSSVFDEGKNTDLSMSNTELKQAKKVCSTCPVSADCLQYATDNALNFGVWGGLGETDRLRLARDSRRAGF